ncbi:hypothetical protein U1Q18_013152 [Sarracenia purpurea var. burkii]
MIVIFVGSVAESQIGKMDKNLEPLVFVVKSGTKVSEEDDSEYESENIEGDEEEDEAESAGDITFAEEEAAEVVGVSILQVFDKMPQPDQKNTDEETKKLSLGSGSAFQEGGNYC